MPGHPTIAVLPPKPMAPTLFRPEAWARLTEYGRVVANEGDRNLDETGAKGFLGDAEVVITSWGSPQITAEILSAAPRLRLHCHAAGSVKPFVSEAGWDREILVTSAAAAIAVGVAETTLGWIIIAAKRSLLANITTHGGGWQREMAFPPGDITGKKVGIIGASHVGRNVIALLKPFEVDVLLYDPYVTDAQAQELGTTKVSLGELMRRADIITLHAPNTDETRHMINRHNLRFVRDGATIINTARGALVDEAALCEELKTGRIWAILDVTDPEPPSSDHPFRQLPNLVLTPHIAGTVENGRLRIGDYVVEEVRRFVHGEPQKYRVTRDMLPRIG